MLSDSQLKWSIALRFNTWILKFAIFSMSVVYKNVFVLSDTRFVLLF